MYYTTVLESQVKDLWVMIFWLAFFVNPRFLPLVMNYQNMVMVRLLRLTILGIWVGLPFTHNPRNMGWNPVCRRTLYFSSDWALHVCLRQLIEHYAPQPPCMGNVAWLRTLKFFSHLQLFCKGKHSLHWLQPKFCYRCRP